MSCCPSLHRLRNDGDGRDALRTLCVGGLYPRLHRGMVVKTVFIKLGLQCDTLLSHYGG